MESREGVKHTRLEFVRVRCTDARLQKSQRVKDMPNTNFTIVCTFLLFRVMLITAFLSGTRGETVSPPAPVHEAEVCCSYSRITKPLQSYRCTLILYSIMATDSITYDHKVNYTEMTEVK